MKELEEKIYDIVENNVYVNTGEIDGINEAADALAKEIKDIAIEYGIYRSNYLIDWAMSSADHPLTDMDLFDQLIKERYKP